MGWQQQSHEFTDGDGNSIGIELDEDGVVEVFYYNHLAVVESHAEEVWTDQTEATPTEYNATVTRIRPVEQVPSRTAPEAN